MYKIVYDGLGSWGQGLNNNNLKLVKYGSCFEQKSTDVMQKRIDQTEETYSWIDTTMNKRS